MRKPNSDISQNPQCPVGSNPIFIAKCLVNGQRGTSGRALPPPRGSVSLASFRRTMQNRDAELNRGKWHQEHSRKVKPTSETDEAWNRDRCKRSCIRIGRNTGIYFRYYHTVLPSDNTGTKWAYFICKNRCDFLVVHFNRE